MSTGGLSKLTPATPEIQEMVDQVSEQAYQKVEKSIATEYRSQVVDGINYFIKVSAASAVEISSEQHLLRF
uniref:Cystatin domain-containing protein n=1 Tax=Anolis carolinensis TaxID=28377 RepID=A0A803TMQ5_ANOCA